MAVSISHAHLLPKEAISRHKTAKEVLRYTAAAQQELLATKAMEKLTNG